ncbi:MAG: SDR family oxidoreductase [Hellea sp.]
MKILVTGGSGFVGTKLIADLPFEDLICVGRNKPFNVKEHQFIRANIDAQTDYISALRGVNVIIHVAARVHIMNDMAEDPITEYREVNTLGTLKLAKQAADAGVKRFIFISTIKVNGESTSNISPFKSSDVPNPEDPYGISKSEAEEQLIELGKKRGLEVVIIRPPLVYGEGVKANFASLFKFVGKRIPLPFRAITNNKRSLVSVYNLVDLIKVCIDHPNAANQIFLVSDDKDISTSEMVALMAKVQSCPNYSLPLPVWCFHLLGKLLSKQDVIDRLVGSLQVDISHTKNTLNWTPPFSIEEGFAKCIERRNV